MTDPRKAVWTFGSAVLVFFAFILGILIGNSASLEPVKRSLLQLLAWE